MEYKDCPNGSSIIKNSRNYHTVINEEKSYKPEVFINPGFENFPQLSTLDFNERESFDTMFDLEFPLFLIGFINEAIEKENEEKTSFFFPMKKKEKTPLQVCADASEIISLAPNDHALKLVGTGFFTQLVAITTVTNDENVLLHVFNAILRFLNDDVDEIFEELVHECSAHLVICDIVSRTKANDVRVNGVNLLAKFIAKDLGEEDTIKIIKVMNEQARAYHGIYNYYLIVAYHHISSYATGFFDEKGLYSRMMIFITLDDPLNCQLCAEGLLNYVTEFGSECLEKLNGENYEILNCIEKALEKQHDKPSFKKIIRNGEEVIERSEPEVHLQRPKTIHAIIDLFVSIIKADSSLFYIDTPERKPIIHQILVYMCSILEYGTIVVKGIIVNSFIALHEVIGDDLLPMLPEEFETISNLCSAFDYLAAESAHTLLSMLADYVYKHPGAKDVYGEEFLETLCNIVDEEKDPELAQLASDMRSTIFPDDDDDGD